MRGRGRDPAGEERRRTRNDSASHCVQNVPLLQYSPSSAVFSLGRSWVTTSSVKAAGKPPGGGRRLSPARVRS